MKKLTEQNIDLILCHLKATATKKMAETFLKHLRQFQPNRKNDELLREIQLYKNAVQEQRKPYHFIFVLDESGSMAADNKWTHLTNAYNMCLRKRLEIAQQSSDDIVCIIQFDSNARVTCPATVLSSMIPQLAQMNGGGTNFSPALNKAWEELKNMTNRHTPVLLFMSDGKGSGGPHEMTKIYSEYHSQGLHVHTIAFGKDADTATLTKLAEAGHGTFHQSITGEDLAKTFVKISTGLTAIDGLIDEFAKRVADAATNKLMLEFL
jgi:Mg-chelatase subunit ChlD